MNNYLLHLDGFTEGFDGNFRLPCAILLNRKQPFEAFTLLNSVCLIERISFLLQAPLSNLKDATRIDFAIKNNTNQTLNNFWFAETSKGVENANS